MTRDEWIFIGILVVNLIISGLYLLWEFRKNENRKVAVIRFVCMLLCPIIGPFYFFIVYWMYKTIFQQNVDLSAVIFSKEQVKTYLKADEQSERDMAPLEEALAVSDKKNLRRLMMNVIRGDIEESLETISEALNSADSETSHYAASVLRDKLNEFRAKVQKLYSEMEKESANETACEEMLMDYMSTVLKQRVFKGLEQERFVNILNQAVESLYQKDPSKMTAVRYEYICQRLLDISRYEDVRKWCMRLTEQFPNELASYTCRLKLYFSMNDKANYFKVLNELRQSDVVIDNETLEVIRVFM